jgi:hypothetical protein
LGNAPFAKKQIPMQCGVMVKSHAPGIEVRIIPGDPSRGALWMTDLKMALRTKGYFSN